jgi:hypothetical protein
MKRAVFLLSLGVFLLVSCEGQEQEYEISNVSWTPCKRVELRSNSELSGKTEVEFANGGVQIKCSNFEVKCDFTTVNVTHTFVNGVLNITVQGDGNARCICYTDVSYTINRISQDEVNVIFINGEQIYCHNGTGSEALCLYLNSKDIDKTIPVINDYLASLNSHLSEEQKLQALTEWLKSNSCVIDASILCIACIYTNPPQGEISFSFQEGESTIEVILDILMTNPLKASICSINEKDHQMKFEQDVIISQSEYENAPNSHASIIDLAIVDNFLKIKFSSGGCNGHTWMVKLIGLGNYDKSNPPQTTLRLSLDNKELCEALITKEVSFNLEPLKDYFGDRTNEIYLNISNKQILYKY